MQRYDDMFRLRINDSQWPDAGINLIDDFESQEIGILFSEPLVALVEALAVPNQ
jgi:hypothetical protein